MHDEALTCSRDPRRPRSPTTSSAHTSAGSGSSSRPVISRWLSTPLLDVLCRPRSVALGTGLLKPNISTMVGSRPSPDDERRDAGFSIFYMGINLGAFSAPLVTGYLAQSAGWKSRLTAWGLIRCTAGTGASPPPASAWRWVLVVYGLQRDRLARRRRGACSGGGRLPPLGQAAPWSLSVRSPSSSR